MYYDLVAIQALYGKNPTVNPGNNTYTFNDGSSYWQAINDSAGRDAIVYNGVENSSINLNPGQFSEVSEAITFSGASSRSTVTIGPGVVIEIARGGSGNDGLVGNQAANLLQGGAGNDSLNGGLGADQMQGGPGNDVYFVDNPRDIVNEGVAGSSGTDGVRSSISFSLANPTTVLGLVENLSLLGTANINAWGNARNNVLTGNAGINLLNGGLGADNMRGLAGNDVYVVDSAGDIVNERLAGGIDRVQSSVSFSLADPTRVLGLVENLSLLGTGNLIGVGNAQSNVITGNAGINLLNGAAGADNMRGLGGNDVYVVDNVGDVVNERLAGSSGIDTVRSSIAFSLANTASVLGPVENLTLIGTGSVNAWGNARNNVITGNAGANTLNGAAGADTMRGLGGNDVYVVDNAGDVVNERLAGGIDGVRSSVSFNLANPASVQGLIENLTLLGTGTLSGRGNAQNNVITGNAGINVLDGANGNDTLTGGAGSDFFLFDTAPNASGNVDRVTDFNVLEDTIRLDNAVMPALGTAMTPQAFWLSPDGLAHDGDDRIVYASGTGWLNYVDASGAAIHLATLAPNLALTYEDFQIV